MSDCCGSPRIANLSTKCSDRCYVSINGQESDGYAPSDMGIDGDDYVSFKRVRVPMICKPSGGPYVVLWKNVEREVLVASLHDASCVPRLAPIMDTLYQVFMNIPRPVLVTPEHDEPDFTLYEAP